MNFDKKLYYLGQKIRKFREKRGFSQQALELAINAASGSLSRIENGSTNPTKETLEKISNVLKLSPVETAELFDVGVFRPENILERLNWLAESDNLEELQQRASDMLFRLHKNYNGGGVLLLKKDQDTLGNMYLSNMLNLELLNPLFQKHFSEFSISISKNPNNPLAKAVNTLQAAESSDAGDFADGFILKSAARLAAKALKFNVGIAYPLYEKDKKYGVIFFTKTKEKSFDEYEKTLLKLLSKHISVFVGIHLKSRDKKSRG